jgi:hypothetical protein
MRKRRVTAEVKDVSDVNAKIVVYGVASGNFSGSPALLRYTFILSGPKIARLEIG